MLCISWSLFDFFSLSVHFRRPLGCRMSSILLWSPLTPDERIIFCLLWSLGDGDFKGDSEKRRGGEMVSTYTVYTNTYILFAKKKSFVTSVIFCPFLAKTLMCLTFSTAHSYIVMR